MEGEVATIRQRRLATLAVSVNLLHLLILTFLSSMNLPIDKAKSDAARAEVSKWTLYATGRTR
jgi:hypothetical protein